MNISKLGLGAGTLTTSSSLRDYLDRSTRTSDLIARSLQPSLATSKVLEDIERTKRLWGEQLSPLRKWHDDYRAMNNSIASHMKAFTEGSALFRMSEQVRQLAEGGVGGFASPLKALSDGGAIAQSFRGSDRIAEALQSTYAFDNRALGLTALPTFDLGEFALPAYTEIGSISRMLEQSLAPLDRFSSEISAAMARMHTPWLSIEKPLISATAFAELQTVGRLIEKRAPFGIDLSATLRERLGDWRDPVVLAPEVQPHEMRARGYADRGLRQELIEFPDEAFDESIVLAGLVPLDDEVDGETAAGLRRTKAIQRLLLELEVRLRRVIDAAMTDAFGPLWMIGRAGNGMADRWTDKRGRDELGSGLPLIEYADFTDYVLIVLRRDNWSQVFRHIFGRREADVRESFQRLHPARVTAAHNRALGRDDYLVAASEIRRLLIVITRRREQ